MKKTNVFMDMDGVLAVYDPDTSTLMYNEDHFRTRPKIRPMVNFCKILAADENVNLYALSAILVDGPDVEKQKDDWLDKFLPEIKEENRIFVPVGTDKADYIIQNFPEMVEQENVLYDDYTVNLIAWENAGFLAVKVLNNNNNRKGTWVSANKPSITAYSTTAQEKYEHLLALI